LLLPGPRCSYCCFAVTGASSSRGAVYRTSPRRVDVVPDLSPGGAAKFLASIPHSLCVTSLPVSLPSSYGSVSGSSYLRADRMLDRNEPAGASYGGIARRARDPVVLPGT